LVGKLHDCDSLNQLGEAFECRPVHAEMSEIPNEPDLGLGELFNELQGLFQTVEERPTRCSHRLKGQPHSIVLGDGEQNFERVFQEASGMSLDMTIQGTRLNQQAACSKCSRLFDGLERIINLHREGTTLGSGKAAAPTQTANSQLHFKDEVDGLFDTQLIDFVSPDTNRRATGSRRSDHILEKRGS
jgi:hypothetical protein